MRYRKACAADVKGSPVRAALSLVAGGYHVEIEERTTVDIEIPLLLPIEEDAGDRFGQISLSLEDVATLWALHAPTL